MAIAGFSSLLVSYSDCMRSVSSCIALRYEIEEPSKISYSPFLQHWENLCECKPNKLRLLYRHSLAELSGLLLKVDKYCSEEGAGESQKDICPDKAVALVKKV